MIGTSRNMRELRLAEVYLCVDNRPDHRIDIDRLKQGDIICWREGTNKGTGKKVIGTIFRVMMELEYQQLVKLTWPVSYPPQEELTGAVDEKIVTRQKRRFCIPFHRLAQVCPWIDFNKAKNMAEHYEPFKPYLMDNLRPIPTMRRPLRPEGLIFDKQKRVYL